MCVTVTVVTGHSVALSRRSHLFSTMSSLHDVSVHDNPVSKFSPLCPTWGAIMLVVCQRRRPVALGFVWASKPPPHGQPKIVSPCGTSTSPPLPHRTSSYSHLCILWPWLEGTLNRIHFLSQA
jgi:hypothetical protein